MSPIKDSTVPPSEVNKEGFFEKWYTLILLTVVYAFNVMDRQILTVLLEPIKADLGVCARMCACVCVCVGTGAPLPSRQLPRRGHPRQ